MAKTGTEMIHVPYKSSGAGDARRGGGPCRPGVRQHPDRRRSRSSAGKVRALAVTSLERAPLLPDVPPMAEFIPGFEATSWHGLFAPAGTPPEIVDKLSAEVQQIMQAAPGPGAAAGHGRQADRQHAGGVRRTSSPAERAKWAEVIKEASVTAE